MVQMRWGRKTTVEEGPPRETGLGLPETDGRNGRRHTPAGDLSHPAEALANYLRDYPEGTRRPPEELAAEFGLEADFVRDVLNGLAGASPRDDEPVGPLLPIEAIKSAWRRFIEFGRRITAKPLEFVLGSTLVATGIVALSAAIPRLRVLGAGHLVPLLDGLSTAMVLVTLIAQFAVYGRHGNVLVALRGTVIVWTITTIAAMIGLWLGSPLSDELSQIGQLLLLALILALVALVYAALATIVALIGKYIRIRREERLLERMSRQDLLERLFEVRSQLHKIGPAGIRRRDGALDPYFRRFREKPWVHVVLFGVAIGALQVALFGYLIGPLPNNDLSTRTLVALGLGLLFLVLITLFQVVFGYLIGRPRQAFWLSLGFSSSIFVVKLIPAPTYGPDVLQADRLAGDAIAAGAGTVVAVLSALVAHLEERAARTRKLQRNDPATLVAEEIRIQWQLAHQLKTVYVMVVDVYKSTRMKAESDPLVAEWSFREYQEFLAETVAQYGGKVHSTAGDGAVIAFESAQDAYNAARAIHAGLVKFNRDRNRLRLPFRVRIGLHAGEVVGELSTIQFTQVIDIAAHVEAIAPVGGIAMTKPVAAELEHERLAALNDRVEGHEVFVSMNPMMDA